MITANGILFHQYRMETSKTGQAVTNTTKDFGELPVIMIKSISISKQAVKTYLPFDNTKSMYMPTAMIGPVVKMTCGVKVTDHSQLDDSKTYTLQEYQLGGASADGLYSNDILSIVQFGYPTWNATLSVGSEWWVDTIEYVAKSGTRRQGYVKYDIELTIYRKDD